jgi:hypothetical protein
VLTANGLLCRQPAAADSVFCAFHRLPDYDDALT